MEALLPDDDRSVFRLAYLNKRGAVAQAGGNLAHALECSLAAVRGWPENSASWGNLALVYEELGQRGKAVEAMSAAVERSVDLRYLEPLVGWLLQADRVEEAARHGEDAVRFHPDNGHAHALRALTRLSLIAADPSKASRLSEAVTDDLRTAIQRNAPAHLIQLIQQESASLLTGGTQG